MTWDVLPESPIALDLATVRDCLCGEAMRVVGATFAFCPRHGSLPELDRTPMGQLDILRKRKY